MRASIPDLSSMPPVQHIPNSYAKYAFAELANTESIDYQAPRFNLE